MGVSVMYHSSRSEGGRVNGERPLGPASWEDSLALNASASRRSEFNRQTSLGGPVYGRFPECLENTGQPVNYPLATRPLLWPSKPAYLLQPLDASSPCTRGDLRNHVRFMTHFKVSILNFFIIKMPHLIHFYFGIFIAISIQYTGVL